MAFQERIRKFEESFSGDPDMIKEKLAGKAFSGSMLASPLPQLRCMRHSGKPDSTGVKHNTHVQARGASDHDGLVLKQLDLQKLTRPPASRSERIGTAKLMLENILRQVSVYSD